MKRLPVVLLALLLAASPAASQRWAGSSRLSGVVLDIDEKPITGAEVRLAPDDAPETGPAPAKSDAKGRWNIGGLAPGSWRIVIEAQGYIRSEGWVQVLEEPIAALEIVLLPLSQVMPAGAETPQSVFGWLEKGNSLLAQGRPAEARAEYEKALQVLSPDQQPEVLRGVARTYYLEKNLDGAVNALERALLFAPVDTTSRQLLTALLEGAGRGDEARAWLGRLDAEGPEALAGEVEQPAGHLRVARGLRDAPVLPSEAGRTGAYRTAFTERSPLSSLDVYVERHRADRAEILAISSTAAGYDLAAETFEVFVPEDYDGATPYGLLVWVSPTLSGAVERPENREVLRTRRMIWVGANNSGNRRLVWDRVGLALDAAQAMTRLYKIDVQRVYAGGYSGGGRMATSLSVLYSDVFQGGLLFMGCNYYRDVPRPDKPGALWPAAFAEPPRTLLKQARERNRYAFVTGENDFNRLQTRVFHRLYEKDGFRHATYLEIPGADHYSGLGPEWLAKALDTLDAR